MSTLVYVHGTNGSGKSTLARAVIKAAGGSMGTMSCNFWTGAHHPQVTYTSTKHKVNMVGPYRAPCGGIDIMGGYENARQAIHWLAEMKYNTFAESLITPGKATCVDFSSRYGRAVWIFLDTPEAQCVFNVVGRRQAKGNMKPYTADQLYKKAKSARRWATTLEELGLEVHRLQYPEALDLTLEVFGLNSLKG